MEVEPAAYISIAVNEAEKAADIKLITFDPVGKYGRMYVSSNRVAEVQTALEAASSALRAIDGVQR